MHTLGVPSRITDCIASIPKDVIGNDQNERNTEANDHNQPIRQSTRTRRAPRWLDDFVINTCNSSSQCAPTPLTKKASTAITYPLSTFPYKISDNLRPEYVNFLTNLSSSHEPRSYVQAKDDSKWVEAMNHEIDDLERNGTWIISELPPRKLAIGCKWAYKIKRHPDGKIDIYKARHVAKGFHQIEGIDYNESFSPVAKPVIVRVLLTVATAKQWSIHQIDINNAYLHGSIDEEVYMVAQELQG